MKTTLRYAAFAVFFALFTLPASVYARAPTTYRVNFNANGGKGIMPYQKFTMNKAARLSSNRYTRKGYVFIGWSTSKTGAVKYKEAQSVKNLAKGGKTTTLYAQWALQNYLVAFFANGGSGSMPLQKHTFGSALKLSANRFKRQGYSFAGWATKSNGPLKFKNKASVKNLTKSGRTIKLYALWNVDPAARVPAPAPATPALTSASPALTSASTALTSASTAASSPALPGDEVDFAQFKWIYGGFNGAAAKLSDKARISGLKASNSEVSYSWANGDCQDLGASSETDASCVACLFCFSDGQWTGGKFDWISTNNKSPSFKNILDQYKGWSSGVLSKAEEYAFVILSKNGAARTNVIRVKSSGYSSPTATSTSPTPSTSAPSTSSASTPANTSADEVDFSLLQWTYGGFKGEQAKLGAQPRISGLKLNNSGMSYSWKSGGCENLGATSASDYTHTVACLFCYSGGKWVGGKFDWVSTSRRTRDLKNVHDGYNGWSPTVFSRAEAYAFVIVCKDGKTRSNVIRCGR